jgi:hypothetical protein
MSEDQASFLARLKLLEADRIELKMSLDSELISTLQILTGVVTVDELEEIGVKENVLQAIRKEIDDFRERERIKEEKLVIFAYGDIFCWHGRELSVARFLPPRAEK